MDYIVDEALIVIPALFIIGFFLKNSPLIPNWVIPWILLCIGIISSFFIVGFNIYGFLQGVLVTGAAVLTNKLLNETANGYFNGKNDHRK